MNQDLVAMFEFEVVDGDIKIVAEKQYELVAPELVTQDELVRYRQRL